MRHHVWAFEAYCKERRSCPQFKYWANVMEMELCILILCTLTTRGFLPIVFGWFDRPHALVLRIRPYKLCSLDISSQQIYGCIGVKHQQIAKEFDAGHFTVQKDNACVLIHSNRSNPERNNATVKIDGGAVALQYIISVLRQWLIAGPEVEEFQNVQYWET